MTLPDQCTRITTRIFPLCVLLGVFVFHADGFQPSTNILQLCHDCHHRQVGLIDYSWALPAIVPSRPTDDDDDDDTILPPTVWIQDAEQDFVDEDENLEDGEVCLKSVKAFASPVITMDGNDRFSSSPRFLSAGALVQRPSLHHDDNGGISVCDAWTADAILEEGGPNLQFQGASLILDELLYTHLEQKRNDPIGALRTFVVQCDDDMESETSCASFLAAKSRGFRPLKEVLRESSIYTKSTYAGSGSLNGMVLDINEARKIYQRLAEEPRCRNYDTISSILQLLPEEDVVQRFTIKRFSTI